MFSHNRLVVLATVAASVLAFPATAAADHDTRHTRKTCMPRDRIGLPFLARENSLYSVKAARSARRTQPAGGARAPSSAGQQTEGGAGRIDG
jgi:hypothetical protein